MAEPAGTNERRTVYFSGRVQGVGFRATAWSIASRYDVSGYVRNLPDGRVELVVEGAPEEVERFLAEVKDAMSHYIRDVEEYREPARGDLIGFEIRY